MASTEVSRWFGAEFAELHPLLQNLHLHGGVLSGAVDVRVGRGVGKFIGGILARKLLIPAGTGSHAFLVHIFHGDDGLHWDRYFGGYREMRSLFTAAGNRAAGYWIETKGSIRLAWTVEIVGGGWQWRCLKAWVGGVRVPLALLPRTTAYKRIEQGRYRFYVGFSLPCLGTVLSYGGLLDAAIGQAADGVYRNPGNNAVR